MKKWILPISIVANLFLLTLFSFKGKPEKLITPTDCACCSYDTIYARGGYYIFRDRNYVPTAEIMALDTARIKRNRSEEIAPDDAAKMVKHLTGLGKVFVTNYIDFDLQDVLSVVRAMNEGQIPEDNQGVRVYFGAYTNDMVKPNNPARDPKIQKHYAALILGTKDGVDLFGTINGVQYPIINYGNLCPPVCDGLTSEPGVKKPNREKAKLFDMAIPLPARRGGKKGN